MRKLVNNRIFAALLSCLMTVSMCAMAFEDCFAVDGEDTENYEVYEDEQAEATESVESEKPESSDDAADAALMTDEQQKSAEVVYNKVVHDESLFRTLSDKAISVPTMLLNPSGRLLNLRESIGEPHNGYAVVQGGCTDGKGYAYYLMVNSSNDKGRLAKFNMLDNSLVQVSGVLNTCHGNGIAYDSKRDEVVVIARNDRKQEITTIDVTTMTINRQENVKYTNYACYEKTAHELNKTHQSYGLGAISYNAKYDVYLALQRTNHNIIVFDPDTFEAVGFIFTTINKKYPGTYQAMDSDDQYVYFLLSPNGDGQNNNLFIALDWNSENLVPYANYKAKKAAEAAAEAQKQTEEQTQGSEQTEQQAEQKAEETQNEEEEQLAPYIEHAWYCNNDQGLAKRGTPDATIVVTGVHEAENIYHTTDPNTGARHFYMSSYYSHSEYQWVTKRVAYKVKWKKVWAKVKWKKVRKKYRKKGKTYYKYVWKYKKKKVWKYKTKYKNVTERQLAYFGREDYVYDLGNI